MADGENKHQSAQAEAAAAEVADDSTPWFDLSTRNGMLRLCVGAAVISLSAVVGLNYSPMWGLDLISEPFLTSPDAWSWLVAATSLLLLPLILLSLDPPDNMATGPGLTLPLVTLGLLFLLAGGAVALKYSPELASALSANRATLTSPPMAAFFSLLAVPFLARAWNAGLFAKYANEQFDSRRSEALKASVRGDEDAQGLIRDVSELREEQVNAEAISAVIATLAVLVIGYLAYLAGGWTENTRIGGSVGLLIAGVILGIFAVVILLDWIAELPAIRGLSRMIRGVSHACPSSNNLRQRGRVPNGGFCSSGVGV